MNAEDLTIPDIVLQCVTYAGRNEEDLIADYERRCKRLKIVPLYGQLKTALKRLHSEGKIYLKTVGGHRLCCKR